MNRYCSRILLWLALSAIIFSCQSRVQTLTVGNIVWVELNQIHPTQSQVGYREIYYKINRYRQDREKRFDDFCDEMGAKGVAHYNQRSTLADLKSFQCQTDYGHYPDAVNTAVVAPNSKIYLTDGHHALTSFHEVNPADSVKVMVRIVADYSQLESMDKFWQQMQQQQWVWLHSSNGDIDPQQLPAQLSLAAFNDDPYRSLIYFEKDIGFKKPTQARPFLEFYWEQWLAQQIDLSHYDLNDPQSYRQLIKDTAAIMHHLKTDTPIATTPHGDLLAGQAGVLPYANPKKRAKLLSSHGKLSYAFAQ